MFYVYYNKPSQGHSTNYWISNNFVYFECLTDNNVLHQNTSKVFKFMILEYKLGLTMVTWRWRFDIHYLNKSRVCHYKMVSPGLEHCLYSTTLTIMWQEEWRHSTCFEVRVIDTIWWCGVMVYSTMRRRWRGRNKRHNFRAGRLLVWLTV